jgi:hypothetical protein
MDKGKGGELGSRQPHACVDVEKISSFYSALGQERQKLLLRLFTSW